MDLNIHKNFKNLYSIHRNIFLDLFFDDIAINVYEYTFLSFFPGAFDIDGICS